MIKILVLIGKTCSGKTAVLNKLCSEHGYKRIIIYTTRPARKSEIDGVSYHFTSEDEFFYKVASGFFAEYYTYTTANGKWHYGSAKDDYENVDEKTAIILTPEGYKDICLNLKKKPLSIYLYSNAATIENRMKSRSDKAEQKRRIEDDNRKFKGIEKEVDFIVYNNQNDKLDDVVGSIIAKVKEYNEKI